MLGHDVPQDVQLMSRHRKPDTLMAHRNRPVMETICICVTHLIIADIGLKTSVSFTLYIYVSICVKRYWLTQGVGTEPI